jgi:carbon-monoxide dehydrogenase large subunit
VINAINDALAPLGVEITRLPASPAAIVEAIEKARKDR